MRAERVFYLGACGCHLLFFDLRLSANYSAGEPLTLRLRLLLSASCFGNFALLVFSRSSKTLLLSLRHLPAQVLLHFCLGPFGNFSLSLLLLFLFLILLPLSHDGFHLLGLFLPSFLEFLNRTPRLRFRRLENELGNLHPVVQEVASWVPIWHRFKVDAAVAYRRNVDRLTS